MNEWSSQEFDQHFYRVLESIRDKLDNINVGDSLSLNDVLYKYRSIFNTKNIRYDSASKFNDIITKKCDVSFLNDVLTKGFKYCWLDFFGSDSFSSGQEKKQVFFATLCEDERSSKLRSNHVFRYHEWLKQNIPVDIFVQLFFSTEIELEKIDTNLNNRIVLRKGFIIDYDNYKESGEDYFDLISNNKDISKQVLLPYLLNSLSRVDDGNLFELNYNNLSKDTCSCALFLQGICKLNYSLHDKVKYILFLPIPCPDGSNGLICMGTQKKITGDDISKLSTLAFTILYPFVSSYKSIWHQIQLKNESVKSAKSAIMSRNMSHNIGSHVMSYLKQQLDSSAAILGEDNKVLSGIVPEKVSRDIINESIIELPFLVGLGKFIGYLQERQDYIATISTDFIPSGTPVNLKDSIYDELNPDLRYLRHRDSTDPNSANNHPQNILFNYIAKSEGLSRENMGNDFTTKNDIRLGYIHYFSKESCSVFGFDRCESGEAALLEMRKINMCLPGGLIGRQAVFSILENLIRNAAKHGDKTKSDNLDFTIDVIDGMLVAENKCPRWTTRIQDPHWRRLYKQDPNLSDYYIVTITDNLPYDKKILKVLRDKALYEEYVKGGVMTNSYKGVKEIRISSAWLRGDTNEQHYLRYSDTGHFDDNAQAPLVAIELSGNKKTGKHLRYAFCIKKNKMVAIVKDVDGIKMDEESLGLFEQLYQQDKATWSIVTKDELLKQKVCYSFILIPDDENAYKKIRPFTSNRLCRWKNTNECSKLANGEDVLNYVYQLFVGKTSRSDIIAIWDGIAYKSRKWDPMYKTYVSPKDETSTAIKFVYRKHHSSQSDYKSFRDAVGDNYKKYRFIEGITGDNSSDRLVRRETLDKRWYYNHLYAMKKKVAVIDERIFKMVNNVNEENLDDLKKQKSVVVNNYQTPCYHDKGVDVYSVIKDTNGNMILVGCVKQEYRNDSFENTFDWIARFDINGRGAPLLVINEQYKIKKYDYITIHQGILDKVYESLNIIDKARKNKVTIAIFEKMMKLSDRIDDYLPRFIIHSGRARPNGEDMPQKLPFIQYAAIENAVKDSKTILIELLDYAKYEQSDLA